MFDEGYPTLVRNAPNWGYPPRPARARFSPEFEFAPEAERKDVDSVSCVAFQNGLVAANLAKARSDLWISDSTVSLEVAGRPSVPAFPLGTPPIRSWWTAISLRLPSESCKSLSADRVFDRRAALASLGKVVAKNSVP